MRYLIIAAALSACVSSTNQGYRLPPTPGTFWIWPDRAEAERWITEHPGLCITMVPDGFATQECVE